MVAYGGVVLEARGYSDPEQLKRVQHAIVVVVQRLEAFGYRFGEIVMPERRLQTLRTCSARDVREGAKAGEH